jgi:hypothetical protein
MGRLSWPDRATRRLEDLSLWDALRAQPTLLYDGSWPARAWWDVRHPPLSMSWIPPWRRHKKRCNKKFEQASMDLMAGGTREDFQRHTGGITYCATCDYWDLSPRHPVFWLVLIFGEH